MKKLLILLLVFGILNTNFTVIASENLHKNPAIERQQTGIIYDDAPKWEEYVAPKYRNPRTDFSRAASITELAIGGLLTSLILTAPIGIPMVIHGTTKVKMVSYANRKRIFDEEIAKAKLIEDQEERAEAYKKILKRCNLKESTRQHYAEKEAKD